MIPVVTFTGWLWFRTGYTVTESELRVQCGPFLWVIPLGKIRKIRRTRNLVSSAALSLDRLEIRYGKYNNLIWISPINEDVFLDLLRKSCPQADITR
ncbi:MAG: PH domain-containing protein [Bacillota bacterium]